MGNLKQKVIATQIQYGHSNTEIRSLVLQEVIRLHKQYCSIQDKKSIIANYGSTAYKSLMKNSASEDDFDWKQAEKCLVDETNINKFLKGNGDGDGIHPKSRDFYAIYCGFEGYNVFLSDNKNVKLVEETQVSLPTHQENLQIPGAIIIDKEYVEKIKTGTKYTPEQFYTAVCDESQWYGIIADYYIPRSVTVKQSEISIEDICQSLFNELTQINKKVAFVISGSGGVGKTTLLRKLAVNLSDEPKLKVLWINEFEQFLKEGFDTLQQKKDINFLVIINDWDHLALEDTNTLRKFLNQASNVHNIRLAIGDRIPKGKVYEDCLEDRNAIFELGTSENEKIIHEIVQKCPLWKNTIIRLSHNPQFYESSLYLILFTIARLNEHKIKCTEKEAEDLFIQVIKSDLEIIAQKYPGLANALYHWSCCYSIYYHSISYDTFLELASRYQKNGNIKKDFKSLDRNTLTHRKLKGLIGVDNGTLRFHHDILVDVGIRQVVSEKLDDYDDTAKVNILDVVTDFENDLSASYFLQNFFYHEDGMKNARMLSFEEQRTYIDKLFNKGNRDEHYIWPLMFRLNLSREDLVYYAKKILENKMYSQKFWFYYLGRKEEDTLIRPKLSFFLSRNQISEQPPGFTYQLLRAFASDSIVQDFIESVLKDSNWTTIDHEIVCGCLNRTNNEKLAFEFIDKIFNEPNWEMIHYRVISGCLDSVLASKKITKYVEYTALKVLFLTKNDNLNTPDHLLKIAEQISEGTFPIIDIWTD